MGLFTKGWVAKLIVALVGIVVLFLVKGVVQVQPGELGVLMTFGKAAQAPLTPGLQLIVPFAQEVKAIRVNELRKLTVLKQAKAAQKHLKKMRKKFDKMKEEEDTKSKKNQILSRDAKKEAAEKKSNIEDGIHYFLTADENLVAVDASIQYQISDPAKFLFKSAQRDSIIKRLGANILTTVIFRTSVDDILSKGKSAVSKESRELLQTQIDEMGLGIVITSFLIGDVVPPPFAVPSFKKVSDARAESEQMISKAQSKAAESLAETRGDARQTRAQAESYRSTELANARGEAAKFSKLRVEAEKAPLLTRQRLSLDAQKNTMENVDKIYYEKSKGAPPVVLRR